VSSGPGAAVEPQPGLDLLTLYDAAMPQVHGYLLSRCGDRTLAEDLTSEVFLAAVAAGGDVGLPWLVGTARHKLVDHWRRRARDERVAEVVEQPHDPWDAELDALRAREVLAALGPHHRAALVLRHVDGLPVPRSPRSSGARCTPPRRCSAAPAARSAGRTRTRRAGMPESRTPRSPVPDPLDVLAVPVDTPLPGTAPTARFRTALRARLERALLQPRPPGGTMTETPPVPAATAPADVAYLTLAVPDAARARAFYGAVLGWSFAPGTVEDGWAVTGTDPAVGLWGGQGRAEVHLCYRVPDLAPALAAVRAQGGTAQEPEVKPYGLLAECTDPAGLRFQLWEPREG